MRLNSTSTDFLCELADALEASVRYGIGAIRRFESESPRTWRLGQLYRVYPVTVSGEDGDEADPDRFNHGIAPSVKLLYLVLTCVATKDPEAVKRVIAGWNTEGSPIFRRLWAALARDASLVSSDVVEKFLATSTDEVFWQLDEFPEVAELRALRFGELSEPGAEEVASRIMRLPPKNQWPSQLRGQKLRQVRCYWALRELKRIQIAGHRMPQKASKWYNENLRDASELQLMSTIDEGFPEGIRVRWSGTKADLTFDALIGVARLDALENALGAERTFDDNPSGSAYQWLGLRGRLSGLVADFENAPQPGNYVLVWDALGRARPEDDNDSDAEAKVSLATRVLKLISALPVTTLKHSGRGISAWLDAWKAFATNAALLYEVWFQLWPVAVALTNEDKDVIEFDSAWEDGERGNNIDTLNNPAGHLVGVFLKFTPELKDVPKPFEVEQLRRMREQIVSAPGRAGLIGQYRLIEHLPWMLAADAEWTRANLVRLVKAGDRRSFILFKALSWRAQFAAVREIGPEMAAAAVDPRADRATRKAMAWTLVAYVLNCFWQDKDSDVPLPSVQQMLRLCDDEVRAHSANVLKQFVDEVAAGRGEEGAEPVKAELVFEKAISPALITVWPQERSLSTPGVARAFADLPAACASSFAEAVAGVERFIVPFDAWSMLEFGFHGADDGAPKLGRIDGEKKAAAFLQLLDLSVGSGEGAVVPYDLASALDQIQSVAPSLREDQRYRRLAALSR
jgi:hypothetical protein